MPRFQVFKFKEYTLQKTNDLLVSNEFHLILIKSFIKTMNEEQVRKAQTYKISSLVLLIINFLITLLKVAMLHMNLSDR